MKNAPLLFRMSDVNTKAIGDSGEQVETSVEGLRGGGGLWGSCNILVAMLVSEYNF